MVSIRACTYCYIMLPTRRPLWVDTVEKLRFEISGDFICDLSVILYSRYEGVVEVP